MTYRGSSSLVIGVVFIENGDEVVQLHDHLREVVACRGDEGLDIKVPVAVNDPVAHPCRRAPSDRRTGALRLLWRPASPEGAGAHAA